jgi:hypothetical protein
MGLDWIGKWRDIWRRQYHPPAIMYHAAQVAGRRAGTRLGDEVPVHTATQVTARWLLPVSRPVKATWAGSRYLGPVVLCAALGST